MAKTVAVLIVLILAILTVPQANGQGKGGKIGVGVFLSTPAPGYNFKYWLSSHFALELDGTFLQVKPKRGAATTKWGVGVGCLQLFTDGDCYPYLGFRFEMTRLKDYGDYGGELLVGMEKFFGRRFSVGGELQLNIWKTDDDFSLRGLPNKSIVISTASIGLLRFYLR